MYIYIYMLSAIYHQLNQSRYYLQADRAITTVSTMQQWWMGDNNIVYVQYAWYSWLSMA